MKNLRTHGKPPFTVAVVHGGPGAAGEMAPVARELASGWGVLEPLQTAASLEGQVEELKSILERNGELPITLIGFSWGAWLGFILAARRPTMVRKLVLIGSGSFEERYASGIHETRLGRLSAEDRAEVESLMGVLEHPSPPDKSAAFARLGALFSKADTYAPISLESEGIEPRADIFRSVWKDAAELRRSGKLLNLGRHVECPVVAIHGDYDPHPAEGVREPLSPVLRSFRFVLLERCGHTPWVEREARDEFYRVLKEELR